MGRIVIACYRPKPGMQDRLIELTLRHVDRLRAEQLVTEREPIAMVADNGVVIEVFEWKSREAIEAAHTNVEVQKLWQQYAEVCDYIPLAELPEAKAIFAEFTPLEQLIAPAQPDAENIIPAKDRPGTL